MGALVELPSEGDLQHLPTDDTEHPAEEKQPEVAVPQCGVRVVRDCYARELGGGGGTDAPGGVG